LRAIIADTGPLYAVVDPDDQYHQRSQSELAKVNREKLAIIVPYPVYIETHKLILQWLGFSQAISFADNIRQTANLINPIDTDYEAAVKLVAKYPDQNITLCDAVTAILANQLKVPVWTYDYHFDVMQTQVWR
jgi:predicted nucleic acid-binding protein